MSFATDDLAQVLVAPRQEHVGWAQGVIRAWDPATFENTVHVRGTDLHDLPVASGVEALTYRPGDVVMIARWKPGGGLASYWIGMGGRVITPGPGAAARTIEFMRTTLAEQISAEVFASRIDSRSDPETGVRTSTGFGNLASPAAPGPAVTVTVSPAGKAICFITAWTQTNLSQPGGFTSQTGIVGVNVTGATSRSPEIINSKYLRYRNSTSGAVSDVTDRSTAVVDLDGLNPGEHTFTLQYSRADSQEPSEVFFSERNLTVIAL